MHIYQLEPLYKSYGPKKNIRGHLGSQGSKVKTSFIQYEKYENSSKIKTNYAIL